MNDKIITAMKSVIVKAKGDIHHRKVAADGKEAVERQWENEDWTGFRLKDLFAEAERLLAEYGANPKCWEDLQPIAVAKSGTPSGKDEPPSLSERASEMRQKFYRTGKDTRDKPRPIGLAIIDGVLEEGSVMSVTSRYKMHKSFLVSQLLRAFATGGQWIGFNVLQSNVLYVDLELKDGRLDKRLGRALKDVDLDATHVGVMGLRASTNKSYPVIFEAIEQELAERNEEAKINPNVQPYRVCILDPLYALFAADAMADYMSPNSRGLDENSNSDMAYLLGMMNGISQRQKCAIVWVHHYAKGNRTHLHSAERGSGAGALARSPDAIITLTMPHEELEDVAQVDITLRDYIRQAPRFLEWDDDTCAHKLVEQEYVEGLLEAVFEAKRKEKKAKMEQESNDRKSITKKKKADELADYGKEILAMMANGREVCMNDLTSEFGRGEEYLKKAVKLLVDSGQVILRVGAHRKQFWRKNTDADGTLALDDGGSSK